MTTNTTKPVVFKPKITLFDNFVAGACAGMIGASSVFPLDLCKTTLQKQSKSGAQAYKGFFDCFWKILKTEGASGLYSGLGPNLVGIGPEKAIKLVGNDLWRKALMSKNEKKLPLWKGALAGALTGLCQAVATVPMEIVKIRRQLDKNASAAQIFKDLWFRGLYTGSGATLLRDIPFSVVFFSLSGWMSQNLVKEGTRPSFFETFSYSLVAGALAASFTTPADVIKTRLQVKPEPGSIPYKGIADVFRRTYAAEGGAAFFKGVGPRVCIIAPMFGIAMAVYDLQKRLIIAKFVYQQQGPVVLPPMEKRFYAHQEYHLLV